MLCINIPKTFFNKLNHLYKFIWNGGNDRVKRDIICNDYDHGGLKMFDPLLFFQAQKSIWVKQLLDPNYSGIARGGQRGARAPGATLGGGALKSS